MAISSVLDPYAALGVAHDASPATVRSSYKKLMLQCHPDKVRGDETQRAEKAQQFQKVQEAYELLIDSRRRRKYDEELAKNRHHSPAAAQAAATAAAASPTSATNGSAQQQGSTKTPPTQTEEDVKQQKDRERQERHERRRRRHDDERRSREEASWNETDREARKAHQARYKAEQKEAGRSTHFERDRYKDEVPKQSSRHTYGSSSSSRYTTEGEPSTRNSSYERTPSSHVPPHAPPPPPTAESRVPPAPPSETETVRPGYEETRAAEEKKLEAVRRRTREAQGLPSGSTRSARSNSHEEDPLAAEFVRQQQAEQRIRAEAELREKEHERRERKARHKEAQEHLSERLGHPADIPPSTRSSGKMSSSPPGRRGSSTVSRDDYGATPPLKPMGPSGPTGPTGTAGLFSGSVPTTGFYSASPHASPLYPGVRRRHSVSSPSLEKQTSRLQRDQQTCDSGYSSPSPIDIPMTFEKKHISSNLNPNPTVRNADGSTINPRDSMGSSNGNPQWKKYTFEVYVREDGETSAAVPVGAPAAARRKTSSAGTGSPGSQHTEPIHCEVPPLPADILEQAAGIGPKNPYFVDRISVDPRTYQTGPCYAASHSGTSHSSHSSPRQPPIRHNSMHGHHHSPKMGCEAFFPETGMPSPGLSRASTYATSTRRTQMPHYIPPSFTRSETTHF